MINSQMVPAGSHTRAHAHTHKLWLYLRVCFCVGDMCMCVYAS